MFHYVRLGYVVPYLQGKRRISIPLAVLLHTTCLAVAPKIALRYQTTPLDVSSTTCVFVLVWYTKPRQGVCVLGLALALHSRVIGPTHMVIGDVLTCDEYVRCTAVFRFFLDGGSGATLRLTQLG